MNVDQLCEEISALVEDIVETNQFSVNSGSNIKMHIKEKRPMTDIYVFNEEENNDVSEVYSNYRTTQHIKHDSMKNELVEEVKESEEEKLTSDDEYEPSSSKKKKRSELQIKLWNSLYTNRGGGKLRWQRLLSK